MAQEKRIIIGYDDFKNLTKGNIIEKDGVKIALSDFGWDQMLEIIEMHIMGA